MKTSQFIVLTCMLATVAVPAVASANSNDDAQIKALEARFTAAFNAKDVDGIMKCYVPGDSLFVFDVTVPRQYVGAAAYRKDWSDFLATFSGPVTFKLNDLSVTGDGKIAYGHSIQHVTGKDTKGQPVDFVVRVSDVYRKIKGKWLIVQEHVSVPIDMSTNKPDMMSKP